MIRADSRNKTRQYLRLLAELGPHTHEEAAQALGVSWFSIRGRDVHAMKRYKDRMVVTAWVRDAYGFEFPRVGLDEAGRKEVLDAIG